MSDRLFALRLFVRVARSGSFSVAGRELSVSQPSVSRIIAALEREVGASLLTRTTRAVILTEAGADYLARIEPILALLEEADHAARGTGELRGTLRAALPSSLAVREVIPRLPSFMQRHPALRIDLSMNDQRQDLVSEGVDVAFRFGALTDSTATARRIGAPPRMVLAAPAYLARAGAPSSPGDLEHHALIVGPNGPDAWSFRRDGAVTTIRVESHLTVSASEGALAAAAAGLGIVSTELWACRAELASGALTPILTGWRMERVQVHAVFPAGRATKPAARAFADYLAENIRE